MDTTMVIKICLRFILLFSIYQNSDRGSVSDGVPEAKVARISLDPDAALAVKQVLSAVWFDGSKVADKSGVTSMEMEPIDVQWLRVSR